MHSANSTKNPSVLPVPEEKCVKLLELQKHLFPLIEQKLANKIKLID